MTLEQKRERLLAHAKAPRHAKAPARHEIEGPVARGECQNPLCGDHVIVYVARASQDPKGLRVWIEATGCTMALASASLMAEAIQGCTRAQAQDLRVAFQMAILDAAGDWPASLSALDALSPLRTSRSRIPCALIAWYALKDALNGVES